MTDERILLITGLPLKASKGEYLYKLFGEYGAVQEIRVGSSSLTRSCAIVVYEQCDAANIALNSLNNFVIGNDRVLRVAVYDENRDKKALERKKRKRGEQAEYKKHLKEVNASPV